MRGRPRPARATAVAPLLLALIAGCAKVIGLGSEPSGEVAGGLCGLPPHPKPSCDACAIDRCCAPSRDCADDELCPDESQCVLACAFEPECIRTCGQVFGSDAYANLQRCLLGGCLMSCLPTEPCLKLIACCQRVPADNVARDACVSTTNRDDSAGCQSLLDSGIVAPFCPDL